MWGPYRAAVELSHQMGHLQTLTRLGIFPLLAQSRHRASRDQGSASDPERTFEGCVAGETSRRIFSTQFLQSMALMACSHCVGYSFGSGFFASSRDIQ